jgi:hypothetical protein
MVEAHEVKNGSIEKLSLGTLAMALFYAGSGEEAAQTISRW